MGSILRAIFQFPVLQSVLRPVTRFFVAVIAVPTFRLFLRNVVRVQDLDKELEKDLEQWFRGSLVLLLATANLESALFGWVPPNLRSESGWIFVLLRLVLAVGVVEMMPDQELFAVIHPGPPRIDFKHPFAELKQKWGAIVWGVFCKYLNRTSPAFVIMTAILEGPVGWWCYGIAISQYLVIGLVTSRDKAMDVLAEFDRQVAKRRAKIVEEFDIHGDRAAGTVPAEGGGDRANSPAMPSADSGNGREAATSPQSPAGRNV